MYIKIYLCKNNEKYVSLHGDRREVNTSYVRETHSRNTILP